MATKHTRAKVAYFALRYSADQRTKVKAIGHVLRDGTRTLGFAILLSHLTLLPYAHAAPQGGNVVGGSGNINQSGTTTTINQQSQNMAIDWQSFDVKQNELVKFKQPNAKAVALNRILSNSASQIRGRIDANGQVILVNPNGVFFTSTATINVGGIIASGLDIVPADFMNGNYIFNDVDGTSGMVVNQGIINASLGGNVALIGKQVRNEGLISAKLGSVSLAAGKQAVLTFDNAGLLGVRISKAVLQNELGIDPAVLNSGTINAESGRVLLTASVSKDIFSQAVNAGGLKSARSVVANADGSFSIGGGADVANLGTIDVSAEAFEANGGRVIMLGENVTQSGTIRADAAQGHGGEIELHASDTTLLTDDSMTSARALQDGKGGVIKVLGSKVGLFDQAKVDASGATGGGKVYLGGGRKGQNAKLRNAEFLYLGENTQVKADALDNGDGGTVIAFAEDTARIYGDLFARGGAQGGDGGFIETSGKHSLDITHAPDVSAAYGNGGLWLLDPSNVTIVNDCTETDGSCQNTNKPAPVDPNSPTVFSPDSNSTKIKVGIIVAALGNGDVEINTVSTDGQDGDITFDTGLNYTGIHESTAGATSVTRTLTLNADNHIDTNGQTIDNNSTDFNILNLVLNADTDGNGLGDVLLTNSLIDTSGGSFTASGVNFTSTQTAGSTNSLQTNGGIVNLDMTGDISITDSLIDTNGGSFTALGVNFTSTQTAGSTNSLQTNGGIVKLDMTGGISITDSLIDTNGGSFTALGVNFTSTQTAGSTNSLQTKGGIVNLDMTGDVSITDSLIDTGSGSFTASGVNFTSTQTTEGNNLQTKGGSVNLYMSGAVSIGAEILTSGGDFTVGQINMSALPDIIPDTFNNDSVFGKISTNVGIINIMTKGADSNGVGVQFGETISETGMTVVANGGSIIQSIVKKRNINVDNTTSLTSSGDVILTNTDNDFTQVDVNAASMEIKDKNKVRLGKITLKTGAKMQVTALSGDITQASGTSILNKGTGAVAAFVAKGNDVTLNNPDNDFSQVEVTAATATLQDKDGLKLGNIDLQGISTNNGETTLEVTAGGDITQASGTGITNKDFNSISQFNATDNAVILNQIGNDFHQVNVNAASADLVDKNGIRLGDITVTGLGDIPATGTQAALRVTASDGNISQKVGTSIVTNAGGAVTDLTAKNADSTTDGRSITLGESKNDFDLVVMTAGSATLMDANAIKLGDVTLSDGGGITLNVTANADNKAHIVNGKQITEDITQAKGTMITNNGKSAISQFSAVGHNIVLNNADNDFTQVAIAKAESAKLWDTNKLVLGMVNLTGVGGTTLEVTANAGTISQAKSTAIINRGGISQFKAVGQSITLDNGDNTNPYNDFKQVNIINADSVSLADINAIELGTINLSGGQGAAKEVTLKVVANADGITQLQSEGITQVAGQISNSGSNAISQFKAEGHKIELNRANNDFTQVNIVDADSAVLQDGNALVLGNVALTGSNGITLDVTTGGVLSQLNNTVKIINNGTGAISKFTAVNTNSVDQSITLDSSGNDFKIVSATGANITLVDTNDLVLGDVTVSDSGGITLDVTTGGALSQLNNTVKIINNGTGAISKFTAVNTNPVDQSITLDSTGNDFKIVSATGANITLVDTNDLVLGDVIVSDSGGVTLDVTTGGALSQLNNTVKIINNGTGAISKFTAVNASDPKNPVDQSITLDSSGNDFNTVSASGANITLVDANDIILDTTTASGTTSGTASGTLNVTVRGKGNITQTKTGAVSAKGMATFTFSADGKDLVLKNLSNALSGGVRATTTAIDGHLQHVTLNNSTELAFDGLNITGDLTVTTTNGHITDTATLIVNGKTQLDAGTADIVLDDTNNSFGDLWLKGDNVTVNDITAVNFLEVAANNLTVTAGGDITDSGSLIVSGTAILNAGSHDVILDTESDVKGNVAGNNFGTVEIANANNVTLWDRGDLVLGNSSIGGTLKVTATGNIISRGSNSGALNVAGTATFTAAENGSIILDDNGNSFKDTVTFNAASGRLNNISLTNNNSANKLGTQLSGDLHVLNDMNLNILGGALSYDGKLWAERDLNLTLNDSLGGTGMFEAGRDLTMNISGALSRDGELKAGNDLTLSVGDTLGGSGAIQASSNNLTMKVGGALNRSGALTAKNDLTLSVGGALGGSGVIQGNHNLNLKVGGAVTRNGDLKAGNDLTLNVGDTLGGSGTIKAGHDLILNLGGSTPRNGAIVVANLTTLNASGQDISLTHGDNDFNIVNATANSLTLHDINSLELGSVHVTGQLTTTSKGLGLGTIKASQVNLDAGSGAISDNNAGATNITASEVVLRAAKGVDTDTQTGLLDVVNGSGNVDVMNEGSVTVRNLVNAGDIAFVNEGDVTVDYIDAGYFVGSLDMEVNSGSVYGFGPARAKADITGFNATIIVKDGIFGTAPRPILVRVNNRFAIHSQFSTYRLLGRPNSLEDTSIITIDFFDAFAGQQLIEVDSLDDVNPAIFTSVRNYVHDDIAIKMPADQRYSDEDLLDEDAQDGVLQ